ncbi:Plasma membrane snare protein [Coniochaeta hoffmannii]|uniref:Plasma membrane snare protein n=1 Tax=Coniochaeta hoffmannii TaxID=91930 RepID=A0AA38SAW5_9PEZI|nr:Plasma membrane snare protein [Coniochaeta hoffmannii]
MKKFGFGKKSEGDDDDRNRSSLFGRKKPAAQEENPYAQQPAEDPYARMTPYQQARANLAAGPQAPRPGAAGLPSGPRPGGGGLPSGPGPAQRNGYGTPPPSYQGSPQVGGGYAPDKFGAAGGYGSTRYGSGASGYDSAGTTSALPSQKYQTRGPGGYGGLGPADEDENRDALLGGARQRQAAPPSYVSTDNNAADVSGGAGGAYGGGYGEQREVTAEELEQEEYRDIKRQINDVRKQTVNSSNNAAMQMENAINVGMGTLARLGQQGESLAKTEKNLDMALHQTRVATDKTKELETLNRSMFAVHVTNPFTSKSRQAAAEQQIIEQHQREAAQREATRKSAFQGAQGMEKTFRDLSRPTLLGQTSRSATERSKYMIEDDSDDEGATDGAMDEGQLDFNLQRLEKGAPVLGNIARAIGTEVDRQDVVIHRIGEKSAKTETGLVVTRAKLSNIH